MDETTPKTAPEPTIQPQGTPPVAAGGFDFNQPTIIALLYIASAIVGVTGLVGLVLFWVPILGLLLAGTGIVLSSVGMSQGRKTGASIGLAIAGLVCGIVGVIPALFFVLPAFFVNFS